MIGFFDSGIGGLTVLEEFRKILPEYNYLYFGDNARCPYGGLDDTTIRQYTEEGVQFLFDQGATIVILACNTATAHAIRYLQQVKFPDRKILGVTIPGAERILEGNYRKVGVLATESTVKNRAYKDRVHIIDNTIKIQEIAAPELVPLIEAGIFEGELIREILKNHLDKFDGDIEAIVLGCTHYPYVRSTIEQIRPGIDIIDPGFEAAKKFASYLGRHPDIEAKIKKRGEVRKVWSKM
ncbi:glutamate racemase [Candidatus Gracilibacteria bacterium CG2_30_37_12]|nr:MAG: glutamate racemase [Candidatus Gracilibacteria bacterium CG2_30_37_12]